MVKHSFKLWAVFIRARNFLEKDAVNMIASHDLLLPLDVTWQHGYI